MPESKDSAYWRLRRKRQKDEAEALAEAPGSKKRKIEGKSQKLIHREQKAAAEKRKKKQEKRDEKRAAALEKPKKKKKKKKKKQEKQASASEEGEEQQAAVAVPAEEEDEEVDEEGSEAAQEAEEGAQKYQKQPVAKERVYKVFIGNLSYTTTEEDIKEWLNSLANVDPTSLRIPRDKKTNKSRGFAFAEFENKQSFQAALKLHHSKLATRRINVTRTAGGGGKGAARTEKLAHIKAKANQERLKRVRGRKQRRD